MTPEQLKLLEDAVGNEKQSWRWYLNRLALSQRLTAEEALSANGYDPALAANILDGWMGSPELDSECNERRNARQANAEQSPKQSDWIARGRVIKKAGGL